MPNTSYGPSPSPSSVGPLGFKTFGADFGSGTNTRPLVLTSEDGTRQYWLWVTTAGTLRIAAAAPTSDTSGVSVGSQT
jgi:hypothetical protein